MIGENGLLLEVDKVTKSFAGHRALDEVDLALRQGSVHAVVGHNGAGKSTLMKVLAGIVQPDSGEIRLKGQPVVFERPREAQERGISMVHQELSVIDDLDIAENIFLGREPNVAGLTNRGKLDQEARRLLGRLNLDWPIRAKCGSLSVGRRQMVEIARAISWEESVLILDEPTSALSRPEQDALFELIERLKDDGLGILYISHRLDEILRLADTVSVLRDGRNVGTLTRGEFDHAALINMMLGETAPERIAATRSAHGAPSVLEVRDLRSSAARLNGISFSVAEGEILGLAGMMGSGRSELFECLFGVRTHESGSIAVDGVTARPGSPIEAMSLGIGLVPEDRKMQGIFAGSSVWKNVTMASTHDLFARFGLVKESEARRVTREQATKLDIKCRSIHQTIGYLSGGNQQKAVLARWILRNPRVLLLDEPTAGIDVGAKFEIYQLIRALATEGIAIVVVSSEFDELVDLCHRILVIRDGTIVDEIDAAAATEQSLVLAATGGTK